MLKARTSSRAVGGEEGGPLSVAGADGARQDGADADTDPPGRGADGHEHGKGERYSGDGFSPDPAEIEDFHETRQRHGEETEDHVPRKAHEMAGQVALGEARCVGPGFGFHAAHGVGGG